MATYRIDPEPRTLHGHYAADLQLVLTIQPGDTVIFRTLDAGWSIYEYDDPFSKPPKVPRDPGRHPPMPSVVR